MIRYRKFAAAAGVAVAALLVGSTMASGAAGVKIVSFSAKYAGNATVKVNGNVADISATGLGTGTPIGKGKLTGTGTGDTSQQPCVPWGGTGLMAGTKKTKVYFKMLSGSQGCGDEEGNLFSINAKAQVTKATGTLAKAKGTLKVTGVYDKSAGTFSAKFSGKLKKPK
jgi:hypothetical protein